MRKAKNLQNYGSLDHSTYHPHYHYLSTPAFESTYFCRIADVPILRSRDPGLMRCTRCFRMRDG